MLKILWLTDTHVDKISAENYQELLDFIIASKADGMWLTGDIGDPPRNIEFLKALFERYKKPVFFVLGNHDFYKYKIADMRFKMTQLVKSYPLANYLSETPGLDSDGHLMVGMDCFANTGQDIIQQMTWDSDHILDLDALNESHLTAQLNALAEKDAKRLLKKCQQQIHTHIKKVSILTHVPPSDSMKGQFLVKPHQKNRSVFYSLTLSDVLHQLASDFPSVQFNVYSGHIHQTQLYQIAGNMMGHVAKAYMPSKSYKWIHI